MLLRLFIFHIVLVSSIYAKATLIRNSPFVSASGLPTQQKKQVPAVSKEALKRFSLNGISQINGVYYFSIKDDKHQRSQWMTPMEDVNGFIIHSYNPATRSISYVWDGNRYYLSLGTASSVGLFYAESADNHSNQNISDAALSRHEIVFSDSQTYVQSDVAGSESNLTDKDQINWFPLEMPKQSPLFASRVAVGREVIADNRASSVDGNLSTRNEPPIPSSRVNRIHNPSGKPPTHLL
ncbi:hypothetical protein QEH59_07675 [Coraliomargarita sp. SDUM461004]|uniref:Uncharacterized protein n=1 Tax=Thalassobacterium sedimentorum TaxID=3041258 RepID=A0ABU1AI51_9BACT|nr:hypothetical protein [Coraliomargarita sp. SDUM461004]MDQ8194299.1 hypothetical protein [Coraliomargarita sp. SDUM461004]